MQEYNYLAAYINSLLMAWVNRIFLDLNFQFDVAYIFTCWGQMFGITFEIRLELVT